MLRCARLLGLFGWGKGIWGVGQAGPSRCALSRPFCREDSPRKSRGGGVQLGLVPPEAFKVGVGKFEVHHQCGLAD